MIGQSREVAKDAAAWALGLRPGFSYLEDSEVRDLWSGCVPSHCTLPPLMSYTAPITFRPPELSFSRTIWLRLKRSSIV